MLTNLHLKNVSETIEDLTLDTLLRFLQAHFKEGNALDLCNRLMSMGQQSDNTKYHFVIRCVEVHQSVSVSFYLCVCLCVCVCVCVCVYVCVCVHVHPSWRFHLFGVGIPLEFLERFFPLPSSFIATLVWSTEPF